MKIYGVEAKEHVNTLSCIFDKFLNEMTPSEKNSLNAAMHLLDTFERDNGVMILKEHSESDKNKEDENGLSDYWEEN